MRRSDEEIEVFSLSLLDTICGALGAFIIDVVLLLQNQAPVVQAENDRLRSLLTKAEAVREEAQQRAAEEKAEREEAEKRATVAEQRLGHVIRDRNIVFVVDVSKSMEEENRIGQVTMGIKMLVSTMDPSYEVDVVFFPNAEDGDYGYLWGETLPVTEYDMRGYCMRQQFDAFRKLKRRS